VEGTQRAIPVSISVETQKGGLHAPTAGNKYDHDKANVTEQDDGFQLRRDYNAVRFDPLLVLVSYDHNR
jgi:hypothetical protein